MGRRGARPEAFGQAGFRGPKVEGLDFQTELRHATGNFNSEEGMLAIRRQQEQALRQLFGNAKLGFGSGMRLGIIAGLGADANTIKSIAKEVSSGVGSATSAMSAGQQMAAAKDFFQNTLGVTKLTDIKAVAPDLLDGIVKDVLPIVGTATAGYGAIKAVGELAYRSHGIRKTKTHVLSLRSGDPAAAGRALRTMLKRGAAQAGGEAALNASKFGTSAASLIADAGTTANIVHAVVGLAMKLFQMGWDIKEIVAGNKRLQNPSALDLTVFKDAPILGAHMIVSASTSDIINWLPQNMSDPQWMDKVERMVKKDLTPMRGYANEIINNSNIEIAGMGQNLQDSRNLIQKASYYFAPQTHYKHQQNWKAVKRPFHKAGKYVKGKIKK